MRVVGLNQAFCDVAGGRQENEVTKRLAAYAALVAVPTMVAGVYGMNFANMPELQWRYGYPVALATMVIIDVYLVYRFRKAKWM